MIFTPDLLHNLNGGEIEKITELTKLITEKVREDLLSKSPLKRVSPNPSAVVFFKIALEFQGELDFMNKTREVFSRYLQYIFGSQQQWKEVVVEIKIYSEVIKKTGPTDSDFEAEMEKPIASAGFVIKFYPW
jgi:hypothetical protein